MDRVSLYKCEDYDYEKVKECIKKIFEDNGGIEKFVSPGEKVAIKPNLVMKKSPSCAY